MKARLVPTARGVHWLAEGWRLFRVAPPAWLGLMLAYLMLVVLVTRLGKFGLAAMVILTPAVTLVFMSASRMCGRRKGFGPADLLTDLRASLRAQLALGVVYLGLLGLVFGAASALDDGALARWVLSGRPPEDEVLDSGAFAASRALALALSALLTLLYWFAPMLAAWNGMGVAQALFYSFFAALMNWRAFLAYGAAVGLVAIAFPLAALFALALATGGLSRVASAAILWTALLLFLPVILASIYASYRDVFGADEGT